MHSPLRNTIPVETLLLAYRSGIFPMADTREDQDVFWVEPRERAILPLTGFRLSKSLRKAVRSDRYTVTINTAFEQVIHACSQPRPDHPDTWISDRIIRSYVGLHQAGHAHSIECWRDNADGAAPDLVGGLYGVQFDRVFCGESMFARADNASKVALAWLVAMMRQADLRILDCQFMTDHLASLGAVEIPQRKYVEGLQQARGAPSMSLPAAHAHFTRNTEAGSADTADAPYSSPGKRIAQSLTQTS